MKTSRLDDQMNSILAVAFIALTLTTAAHVFTGATFGRQIADAPQVVAKTTTPQHNVAQAPAKPETVVASAR